MSNEGEKKEAATTLTREAQGADILQKMFTEGKIAPSKNETHRAEQEAYGREMIKEFIQLAMKGQLVISRNTASTINTKIGAIDKAISDQLNEILHHEEFQKLEASWRGLHYLVMKSETDTELKLKVLNASKEDLNDNFNNALQFDQSALFKKVHDAGFGVAGGEPFGALIGDYEFTHRTQDMDLLERIAGVAAQAHAPFISAASPDLFGWESFTELSNPIALSTIFDGPNHVRYRAFRAAEDSRYVGLTLPHVLMRLPYGPKTVPTKSFIFTEEVDGKDHSKFLWGNAAYAYGARLTDSFKRYKWCARIRGHNSGGKVEGLPTHTFKTDEGDIALKCPTEISITDRRDKELSDLGFIPLVHYQNTNYAVFFSAQSVQQPKTYSGPDKTAAEASARLSARLPYIFAASRFAHYLKAMMRDYVGDTMEREDVENFLNKWIADYKIDNPQSAGPALKAEKPLRAASVTVEEDPADPGVYNATVLLRPHFQIEEVNATLSLVASLPKPTGGG